MHNPRLFSLFLLLAPALTGGCDYVKGALANINPPFVAREGRILNTGTDKETYPATPDRGDTIEIEVIRTGNGIQLDNRTTRDYPRVTLWLNQEFGAPLGDVAIGRGDLVALRSFVNKYGEHYPVAKFLEPDADRPLVSAEITFEGDEKLHPVTVRLGETWRRP